MRISDWSSDVCSSDLRGFSPRGMKRTPTRAPSIRQVEGYHALPLRPCDAFEAKAEGATARRGGEAAMIGADRKSVVEGKSVSVRVDLGGRRIIKKQHTTTTKTHDHNTKPPKQL